MPKVSSGYTSDISTPATAAFSCDDWYYNADGDNTPYVGVRIQF